MPPEHPCLKALIGNSYTITDCNIPQYSEKYAIRYDILYTITCSNVGSSHKLGSLLRVLWDPNLENYPCTYEDPKPLPPKP